MIQSTAAGPGAGSTITALSAVLRAAFDPECLSAFGAGSSPWFAYFNRVCDHAAPGFPAAVEMAFAPGIVNRLSAADDAEWFATVRPRLAGYLAAAPVAANGAPVVRTDAPPTRTDAPAIQTARVPQVAESGAAPQTEVSTLASAESNDPAAQTDGGWDANGIHGASMIADAKELAYMPTPPSISPQTKAHLQRMRNILMARHQKDKSNDTNPLSLIVEAHGQSVQIVRKPNGTYHRRHTVFVREIKTGATSKEVRQRSLGTAELPRALQLAKEFLRRVTWEKRGVTSSEAALPAEAVSAAELRGQTTVADAIERYIASDDLCKLSAKTQSSYRSALAALAASLGPTQVLECVGPGDLKRHCEKRLLPGFRYRPVTRYGNWGQREIVKEKAVFERTINSDLTTFAILWNWCMRTMVRGEPLVSVPMPAVPRFHGADDEHRPTASSGRSEALMTFLDKQIEDLSDRMKNSSGMSRQETDNLRFALRRALYARLGLVLAGLFGVRRSSIASLRWEDVDLKSVKTDEGPRITFLAKNTAGGRPIRHPALIPAEVFPMLELLFYTLGSLGVSEYVFPQATTPSKHVAPDELGKWLDEATADAGLPKLKGGVWHPFRRGWAQALLALGWDAQQVAKYGGWKDVATFHRCYALRLPETEKAIIVSTTMAQMLTRRGSGTPAETPDAQDVHPAERAMTMPTKRSVVVPSA